MPSINTKHLKYFLPIVFSIASFIILAVMNGDYLYALQEHSLFIKGHTFMADTLSRNNGWLLYAINWFLQFFYYPWLGTLMLIALSVALYAIIVWGCRLKKWWCALALVPQCVLIYNILCIGYNMYYKPFSSLYWTLPDSRLHSELKMYRAIDEGRWDDVLSVYSEYSPTDADATRPTTLMTVYKNIALMHTGRLTEMFKYGNQSTLPKSPKERQLNISMIAAPMLYYQFGQINYAYRWAMETSVMSHLTYDDLKIMTLCAIFNQEFDLAAKYLALLKATTFHRDWAYEHERWIMSSNYFIQSEDFKNISQLVPDEGDFLDRDDGLPLQWTLNHFYDLVHKSTPRIEEVALCTALWTYSDYEFLYHFEMFLQMHPNAPVPVLYQEAAILMSQYDDAPESIKRFPYDKQVIERFNSYIAAYNALSRAGLSTGAMAHLLRPKYGNTYWWHRHLSPTIEMY